MDASGNMLWTENGVQLANDINNQDQLRMAVDNNGGAFFTWMDGRGEDNPVWSGADIYLEHVNPDGNITFGGSGIPIDQDSGPQKDPLIKCNSSGESYVIWADLKDGANISVDLQIVTTAGPLLENNGQEVWYGVDGNALLSNSINLSSGKYLVAWEDNRFFSTGRPGSYTYGLVVEEDMDMNTHQTACLLYTSPSPRD